MLKKHRQLNGIFFSSNQFLLSLFRFFLSGNRRQQNNKRNCFQMDFFSLFFLSFGCILMFVVRNSTGKRLDSEFLLNSATDQTRKSCSTIFCITNFYRAISSVSLFDPLVHWTTFLTTFRSTDSSLSVCLFKFRYQTRCLFSFDENHFSI